MGVTANDRAVLASAESLLKKKPSMLRHVSKQALQNGKTHIVRINVLGLAGITADRKRCRAQGKKKKKFPCHPEEMCAVVSVARDGGETKGTTGLSKPLSRTPAKDVVVTGSTGSKSGDSQTLSTRTSVSSAQRHIAVWAGKGGNSIGNMVAFHEELKKLDQGESQSYNSEYAPKTFKLIVALTENSSHQNKVAIPFGVANLNICGDNCPDGETHVIDLPLLTLKQAKPLADYSNGLGDFDLIAVRSEKKNAPTKQGRNPFKRLLGMEGFQKVPSIAQRRAFSWAYSADATGDAILRIQLQVVALGRKIPFNQADNVNQNFTPGVNFPSEPAVHVVTEFDELTDTKSQEDTVGTTEQEDEPDEGSTPPSLKSTDSFESILDGSETLISEDGTGTLTGTVESGDSETLVSEDASADVPDDAVATDKKPEENKIDGETSDSAGALDTQSQAATPQEEPGPESKSDAHEGAEGEAANPETVFSAEDDYTLSFEKPPPKPEKTSGINISTNLLSIKQFATDCRTRFRNCGPILSQDEGAIGAIDTFFDDEITMVTADLFGKDVKIPICALMKPDDYDDETETYLSLKINNTLSTFTDIDRDHMAKHFKGPPRSKKRVFSKKEREKKDDSSIVDVVVQKGSASEDTEESDEIETVFHDLGDDRRQEKMHRPSGVERLSESLSNIFGCGPCSMDDIPTSVMDDVPTGVVIRGDGESIGELTAGTFERQKAKRVSKEQKDSDASSFPLPIACGGNGVFTKRKVTLVQQNDNTKDRSTEEEKHCEDVNVGVELSGDYFADDPVQKETANEQKDDRDVGICEGKSSEDHEVYAGAQFTGDYENDSDSESDDYCSV